MIKKEEKDVQLDNIVKYWRLHRGTHTLYAAKFFLAEIMNFANIIGQVKTNQFLLDLLRSTFRNKIKDCFFKFWFGTVALIVSNCKNTLTIHLRKNWFRIPLILDFIDP